jgi:hypothetical protein
VPAAARPLGDAAGRGVRLRKASADDGVPWWALTAAALSPALLVSAWTLAGAMQPPTYRPLQQTISVLAGPSATNRWVMTAALFGVGGCYFITAAGLTAISGLARLFLVVAGVAAVGLAMSPVPAHGSTPRHLAWTVVGSISIAGWPAVVRFRGPLGSPVLGARSTTTATAVFVVLLGWTIAEAQGGHLLGLAERLSTSVQICWPLVIAVALQRRKRMP